VGVRIWILFARSPCVDRRNYKRITVEHRNNRVSSGGEDFNQGESQIVFEWS